MIRLRRFAASARQACTAIGIAVALPTAASAQPYLGTTAPHRGSFEVSGGVSWTGGYDAGTADGTLTRPGGGTPLILFTVSGRVLSAPGVVARLGIFLGRRVSAEATFEYNRPILRTHVTGDFELAPDTDADATITSYLAGGSLVYHFTDGRVVPFVSGGGGYLRQLHEANTGLVTGTEVHAGGGVKIWLGAGAKRFGLRVDAGASARSKAAAFVPKRRVVSSVGAGMIYLF